MADPKELRARAEQLLKEEATLRARADALAHEARKLTAQAREIELAQMAPPIRKRWGGMVAVNGVVSVEEARRSADPDAVAREAKHEIVGPGADAMKAKGNKTRQRVEAAWREAPENKPDAIVADIVKRLGVSERTAWNYKPKS